MTLIGILWLILTTAPKKTASEVIVTNYDLGNYVFEENGGEITSPIKSTLGIPVEDNAPIVFIVHGSHDIAGDVM